MRWAVAAAVAAQAAVFALGSDALALILVVVALAPACWACMAAARGTAGAMRTTWAIATASAVLWLVSILLWAVLPVPADPSKTVAAAEIPLLVSTALAPLALIVWPRATGRVRGRGSLVLDALLSAGALLYVSWPLLLHRFFEQSGAVAAAGAAYTGLDILTITVGLLVLAGRRRLADRALMTILPALGSLVAADVLSSILRAAGSPLADRAITGFSVLGALLILRAARLAAGGAAGASRPRWLPLLAPWLPLAAGVVMAVYMKANDDITGGVRLIALTVLALTVVRLAVTARENHLLTRRLEHRATHDPLTGLPNRTQLGDRLRAAAEGLRGHIGVLLVDLDQFRTINETLGHDVGDAVLCAVADRLCEAVGPTATVARLGGDEFLVVVPDLPADPGAARAAGLALADGIREALAHGVEAAGRRHVLRASAGLVLYDGGSGVEDLVGDADLAMYTAKDGGRDRVAVFTSALRDRAVEHAQLEEELRAGLGRGELRVAYQPIVDLATGEAVAAEALVRWEHPERGLLAPGAFLGVAEQAGLMPRIGEIVLAEALAEQRRWPLTRDGRPRRVTVNLAADDLRDPGLPQRIQAAVRRSGSSSEALVLEITEKLIINDVSTAARVLHELSADGVQIAFDDFGSGHSGLSHLRDLPVDIVKLDRSFVRELDSARGRVMVSTVLDLAAALGMRTVAEGIEQADELEALREMGCECGQGFALGRPMPAGELRAGLGVASSHEPVA